MYIFKEITLDTQINVNCLLEVSADKNIKVALF